MGVRPIGDSRLGREDTERAEGRLRPPDGYYNMERMLKRVVSGKGEVLVF